MADQEVPEILRLEQVAERRYRVRNEGDPDTRDVVFGGQLLAQSIVAAGQVTPGKFVKTIHAIFARPGSIATPTELEIDTMHEGRALASHTITAWQGDRLCARSMVLMSADEPDVIRHESDMPKVEGPEGFAVPPRTSLVFPGSEYRIVDDVDTWAVDAPAGPPELNIWYRYPGVPDDRILNQAVLAWGTDGFLIGTAMRPHAGVGQDRAHHDLSTGVVSHTLTFHRPFTMHDWVLMAHESPFAGGGRTYGRCHIYAQDGELLASYVQDNLVRSFGDGQKYEGQYRTIM